MHATLRDFVAALSGAGELTRVRARVSPVLEIATIADRESRRPAPNPPSAAARAADPIHAGVGGKALLFEHVEGSDIPVLINAFGSYRRMEMALGCEQGGFASIAGRIGDLVKPQPPRSLGEAIEKARQFAPLLKIGPKRRRSGLCQEVVHTGDEVDLTTLPLLRCWPDDGDFATLGYPPEINDGIVGRGEGDEWDRSFRGRYVTLAGIHTIHADDAGTEKPSSHNIGMYRVQLMGRRHMAMHWQMHHDGAKHWRSWKKLGKPMPVALVFGGESVLPYAATCPLPPGISELLMAGFLNGKGIPLVRADRATLGAGQRRDRDRGLCLARSRAPGVGPPRRRAARERGGVRGALRRPHRVLLPAGSLSAAGGHGDHTPPRPDLPGDGGGAAAAGGLLPRQGDRAGDAAAAQDDHAGHRGLRPADVRGVPQRRGGADPQGVPAARPARDARGVGRGADELDQERVRGGRVGGRARPPGGAAGHGRAVRPDTRHRAGPGPDRRAGPRDAVSGGRHQAGL
ncbi:MAG: hypothetical protein HND58_09475 [Planctomycetota bacterium]|nr:MAG: hypothetical protein HND58_09475 [Planctomycetota bacterium]